MSSIFNDIFGTGSSWSNPANAAMPYLQQIPGTISPYYQPYINTGQNSMNQYYNNSSQWATPQGASNDYNTIAAGYTTSPYAQYQDQNMINADEQFAAASGQAGTPAQQAALADQINGINSKDEQAYINSILGIQTEGEHGLQDLTHLGYNASNTLAGMLSKNLSAEGALAYTGQANQNKYNAQQGNMWSSIFGTAASAIPWLAGGLTSSAIPAAMAMAL